MRWPLHVFLFCSLVQTIFGEEFVEPSYKLAPIVIIPGFFSTKLVSYSTTPCLSGLQDRIVWGTMSFLKLALMHPKCAYQALTLGPDGVDVDGITLRAATGPDSLGLVGYPVWDKIVERLLSEGYSYDKIYLAGYDWRLSLTQLETRDQYFSRMKTKVEEMYEKFNQTRVALAGHSLGCNIAFYFLQWVSRQPGGRLWVSTYLSTFINIAGPMLGTPKALVVSLFGGSAEIANLGKVGDFLENILGNYIGNSGNRTSLFQSWSSIAALLPMGGDAFWGKAAKIPFSPEHEKKMNKNKKNKKNKAVKNLGTPTTNEGSPRPILHLEGGNLDGSAITMTAEEGMAWLQQIVDSNGSNLGRATKELSYTAPRYPGIYPRQSDWFNPLISPLPTTGYNSAFTINCLYGVGEETEIAYHLQPQNSENANKPGWAFNWKKNLPPLVKMGVEYGNGDQTVPLTSLGYMCRKGWKRRENNPSAIPVYTREFKKEEKMNADSLMKKNSVKHVDIMHNENMIDEILLMLRVFDVPKDGEMYQLKDRIYSNIDSIAELIRV